MSTYLSWDGAEIDPGSWQGIEFLSVVSPPPGFAFALRIHLARPAAGMTEASIELDGGRSITLGRPQIALANGSQIVDVRFPEKGDHSPYTIRLLSGGADPLDPFFAEAQFSFFIDCETGDCRAHSETTEAAPPQPPSIDARYKDFRGFMRMLSEWVRVANPDWADISPASQEAMLLELLAHQGDMLGYYQDRVANEAFLGSASQRHSLRQHALLLGFSVFEGSAARAMLAFEVTSAGFVPAGLSVENRRLHGERPIVFYVRSRARVDPANNSSALVVAAWPGAAQATIPAGSNRILLWGQANGLLPAMSFAFVQGPFAQVSKLTSVRLLELPGWAADPTDALSAALRPLTEIAFDPPLGAELKPWDQSSKLRLYANLAEASHGAPRVDAVDPAPAGAPLTRRNSIAVPAPNSSGYHLRALETAEGPVIFDLDPAGRLAPVLDVYVDGRLWQREDYLHNSQSFDAHYVAGADNSGRVWIQFGDGIHGSAVPFDPQTGRPLVPVRIDYRVGEPLDGNCSRDTLTEVVEPAGAAYVGLGVTAITNVTPGEGGQRKATLDEIRDRAPLSLRHGAIERAVSLSDYAEAARQVPGVSRAAAKALGGPFNTVLVLIDADDESLLTDRLRQDVEAHIDKMRMAGREHFVRPADYVPLHVELIVCVEPGYLRHEVRDRVLAALRPGSKQRPGYFHPDKLTFGQDLESGDLLAFVQSVAGVRAVKVTAFCRRAAPVATVEDRILFGPTEVARLDADEDFPENGVLKLGVIGLDVEDESVYAVETAPGANQ